MAEKRVQFSNIVQNQLPAYVQEDFPLVAEFFKSYYQGQEYQGGPVDLIQNIDQYIKVDETTNLTKSVILDTALGFFETTISVDLQKSPQGTRGFPDSYGLLLIEDEIITYTGKTDSSFTGCERGFSGVTSYKSPSDPQSLLFKTSEAQDHASGSTITNLSVLFLQEFLIKTKRQFLPGLDDRELHEDLDQNVFIKQAKDFYLSKGSDKSFEILFKALYNEEVRIVRPGEFLFTPSNANYEISDDLIVEPIDGDPLDLELSTLFQDRAGDNAYASIGSVEPIEVGYGNTFYRLKVDAGYDRDIRVAGATYGAFSVQPRTKLIGQVSTGTTTINVDSTVGFGQTGDLYINYVGTANSSEVVSYTSKSLTQFYGLSDINGTFANGAQVGVNTFAYGQSFSNSAKTVLVRINAVLNKFDYGSNTRYYSKDDTVKIKTLGDSDTRFRAKNWFYNISPIYKVKKVDLIDASDQTYQITLFVDHYFQFGDSVTIISDNGAERGSNIIDLNSDKVITVKGQGNLDITDTYTIRRNITQVQSNTFPIADKYSANVQNVYKNKDKLLVASPSIPYYDSQPLNVYTQSTVFSGTFDDDEFEIAKTGDHGFYTGDEVYYIPEKVEYQYFDSIGTKKTGIKVNSSLFTGDVGFIVTGLVGGTTVENRIPPNEGLYFIQRISESTVKLAKSRTNIFNNIFVTLENEITLTNCVIKPYSFRGKTLESQKILREIGLPESDGKVSETEPGFTGIFINGVEILNYKSKNFVSYGKITDLEVTSPGEGYDIINPPLLSIEDSVGTGATGYVAISGSLERIRILDSGFDYQGIPVVTITGGNGQGAQASVNMKEIEHSVSFNSQGGGTNPNVVIGTSSTQSTIGFGTYHKFKDGEKVIYVTDGQQNIGGLTTNTTYYTSLVGLTTVKLHTTPNDALVGLNTVSLTSHGVGKQYIKSYNTKSVVDSINVVSNGYGYENKRRTTLSSGISTSSNIITINNHDYESGEIINYVETSDTVIGGLTTSTEYYVTKVTDNSFKLSNVGVGTTNKDFLYDTKQYVDFTSIGVGTHTFNYPDITVSVIGNVGIASTGTETFGCKIQPIFRGEVTSIHLSNDGVGYGSSEIINFLREPQVSLVSGDDAQLSPIVVDGSIIEVVVLSQGQRYNCAPDLVLTGDGIGAVITPVFENNAITSVKVIHGGVGYTQSNTSVSVVFPGGGVEIKPRLQTWRINLFEKNLSNFSGDDGWIAHEFTKDMGLQYSHLYAPRKLRESVFATNQEGQSLYGDKDLKRVSSLEVQSNQHSPILGWAYDGNPIYGPYGYATKSGGIVSQMRSGYSLNIKSGRPPVTLFPEGFFVEDYSYKRVPNDTILDENNGRFCITPEFPEGTYAYFTTVNDGSVDSSGAFNQYKRPVFPYVIGENYHSIPNEFNFAWDSTQTSLNLENSSWIRNTEPYNLIEGDLEYEYTFIPDKLKQTIDIKAIFAGSIDNIGIETGGKLYQINDSIVFDNIDTQGAGAVAKVSLLEGKDVNTISIASSSISGVEVYPGENKLKYTLISDNPHNFENNDNITISGLSTTSSNLGGFHKIGVSTHTFVLTGVGTISSGIGTDGITGIVTYLNVTGNLSYPYIKENDILGIGTEKVKVLNIEPQLSRIRVLRGVNGTVAVAHTVTTLLIQDPRRLTINVGSNTTTDYKVNKQIYFNPSETVGLGTTAAVGIGSTLYFSNPGTGISQIFIPTKTVYIPGHKLSTGDKLTYSPGNGSGIVVVEEGADPATGISTLSDGDTLYAARISDSLIGLSTVRVGLGTTGTWVGIATTACSTLYFTGVGTGVYHSLKTNYIPITAEISRNLITVAAASSHGLTNDDEVIVNVNPLISTSFTLKYNDYNRKVIIDAKSFTAAGVNTSTNAFTITDHGFVTGQKVIYTADSPIEGLVDNGIYYIVKTDSDTFKLSDNYYHSTLEKPFIIGISSSSVGTINPINPPLTVYKDSTVSIGLSDASLAYTNQGTKYSAFELNFYTDKNLTNIWNKNSANKDFNVTRTGTVGITADAKVTLSVTSEIPETLYYKLDVLEESEVPAVKKEVNVDTDVILGNEILTKNSLYNGTQTITIGSTTVFTYTVEETPEQVSYAGTTSIVKYKTTSPSAYGSIESVQIKDSGRNYHSMPGITTVISTKGEGAVLEPTSTSIGRIAKAQINNIGYNFPSDSTLKPSTLLPQIIDLESLGAFEKIGITSAGYGYAFAPKLIVFDGKTKKQVKDADIDYSLGDTEVTIRNNPTGLSLAYAPIIIPIHNTNGVGISTVGFNTITKDAFVKLSVGFSTADIFPFAVGDEVLIENISVGVGSTGKGFNSSDFEYKRFIVNAVDANIGGIGATITYSMETEFPSDGTFPGKFDPLNSAGRIIPSKYFPQFNISLKTNDYLKGEKVTSNSASGEVESWNPKIGVLKISASKNFVVGEVIKGSTSNTQGIAASITSFESDLTLDATSKVEHGWVTDSGILNDNMQRIQDNFYYQKFSYSLRSKVTYDTWNDVVSTINHTLGFKKFSDYQLESVSRAEAAAVGLSTDLTSFEIVTDLIGHGNLHCVQDFDLVTENSLNLSGSIFSDEIIFSNRILMDYVESVGNRVLSIDDMSGSFNSNPRATAYSVVDTFSLNDVRAQKYITYVVDQRYTQERQAMMVSLLHDGSFGYMNQYGRVETQYDQGSFDFMISGTEGKLLWYPNKYTVNDYDISVISYNLNDNYLGIGSTSLGNIVDINTSSTKVPTGTTTTVVGIASTYRSVKVLVEITPDAGGDGSTINSTEWEYDELNIVHNGSTVDLLEYGQLVTSPGGYSSSGYGTYYPYISGSDLKVDFVPNAGIGTTCVINTIQVAISSESSSGIATLDLNHARIEARTKSISASGTPIAVPVGEYPNDYDCAYFIVQVSDTTNNRYQTSEIIVVDNYIESASITPDTYMTEYGILETDSSLGLFTSQVSGLGTSYLYFQPNASIDTEVKVYMNALKTVLASKDQLDFTNATIDSGFETYTGTDRDIKRSFNLTHKTYPIFERYFLGNDDSIVNTTDNTITIPNHFWVTGEQISYKHVGSSSSGIGIVGTSGFSGVGQTTHLPETLFVVKVNEDTIKIAETAEKALKVVPDVVGLTTVGIGTSHRFISTNQNAKALLALDNIIQSPVVSTAVTTTLSNELLSTQNIAEFSGIGSFFGADLIKVGSGNTTEIMKIEGVGIGSTNYIRVRRNWLGSSLSGFGTGDLITKIDGNYNIVNNLITFSEAPYGNVPLSSTTNAPDDRDWVGISTGSSFQGRTFMRSGETGGTSETYSENYIFDSLSNQFNGINNSFTLQSEGSNVIGIQTDTVILVNDVFQGNGSTYDYTISQNSGISTITFTGTATSIASDPGGSNLPMGGVIVSVGSSEGFGYQPLVAAGGTAIVSTAGTVQSVSIGLTGSGYRSGIQTVNVAIKTESLRGTNIVSIGTATVDGGYVTGIAVTNPHVFYSPRTIANVGYNSTSGVTTVTTATPHALSIGDEVVLSGIAFTCDYSPRLGITNVGYNTITGIMTVTTATAHGYNTSGKTSQVIFTGLAFTCGLDNGDSTHYYPRGQDLAYDTAVPITKDGTSYTVSDAAYNPVTGITTLTIANHGFGNGEYVKLNNDSLTFACAKDNYATRHTYPRSTDPIAGQWVSIANTTTNTFEVQVLSVAPSTNTSAHTFVSALPEGLTHNDGNITFNVGYSGVGDQFTHTFVGVGTSAVIVGGDYNHQFVSATSNAVIAGGDYTHTFVSVGVGTISITGIGSTVVTDASYTASTGELVLTVGSGHTYTTDNTVGIATSALIFTCSLDQNTSEHTYPRSTDPVVGLSNTAITATTDSTITVNVGASPLVYYDVSDAVYNGDVGIATLTIGAHSLSTSTSIRLANESLTFRCAMDDYATLHTYPRYSDPGFSTALGITTTTSNTISINVGISSIVKWDVTSAAYNVSSGIMTVGIGTTHRLRKGNSIKIATESLTFTCSKDSNATTHRYPRKPDPYYSGTPITAVNSTTEFEVNIGVSTVPTYYVGLGSVQAAIMAPRANNNSATKTDPAANSATVLDVLSDYSFITNTGISTLAHYYARGGNLQVPLEVVIDDPVSYSNMALDYASNSSGIGTAATIDVVVGQGSSIIGFTIQDTGYGYGNGESLTVPIGGTIGIPTTSGYKEFLIDVNEVFNDEFTGWSLGLLQMLDNWNDKFDGDTKTFQLTENGGDLISIRSRKGSKINVQDIILIWINDVLQVPGEGYTFNGGSIVTFTEAPKEGDTSKVIFYKGSGAADVIEREIIETVKKGDDLTINRFTSQPTHLYENTRVAINVDSTDIVSTNPYYGPGNTADESLERPVTWCRQTEDRIINGLEVGKDRELYEPQISPFAYLIKTVGIGSTTLYVDNIGPLFNQKNEKEDSTQLGFQNKVDLISQGTKVGAIGTAIVSAAGTITSIDVTDGGAGYVSVPSVSIASTTGIGTNNQAFGLVGLTDDVVTSVAITSPGVGYTWTNVPSVLIEPPVVITETDPVGLYTGDSGIVVGFATDLSGGIDLLVFDIYIPQQSWVRNSTIGIGRTLSGITTNDYFVIRNSYIGFAETSIKSRNNANEIIAIGTAFVDNIYQVDSVSTVSVAATSIGIATAGTGTTDVRRINARISGISTMDFSQTTLYFDSTQYSFDNSGLGARGGIGYTGGFTTSEFLGDFSYGKIELTSRAESNVFNFYGTNGIGVGGTIPTGIHTSALVIRSAPLRYKSYGT